MKCNQCQSEMVTDCDVQVKGAMYGIKIIKRGKGLFKSVSEQTKAAVCPDCGQVAFYIEDYKKFNSL